MTNDEVRTSFGSTRPAAEHGSPLSPGGWASPEPPPELLLPAIGISRAVVFGGSGFIGRYVVQRLAHQGVVVAVVGRHAGRANYLIPMGDVGQIAPIQASLANRDLIRRVLEGADTVINLAGILAEGGAQRFEAVHAEGAATVARLAAAARARRLVHFSALGADPDSPSRYARSKAEGERAVREHFATATILRPSVVFGPEDQFFNRFARMATLSPVLPLIGGGTTRFQPVYVGDVADAAIAALHQEQAHGRIFELGGPKVYTFREIFELLLKEIAPLDEHDILHRHVLVSIPFGVAEALASVAQLLPGAPLTVDQVKLLRTDNVVSPNAATLRDLGIEPTAPELILPTYLDRYKPGGWYAVRRMTGSS